MYILIYLIMSIACHIAWLEYTTLLFQTGSFFQALLQSQIGISRFEHDSDNGTQFTFISDRKNVHDIAIIAQGGDRLCDVLPSQFFLIALDIVKSDSRALSRSWYSLHL